MFFRIIRRLLARTGSAARRHWLGTFVVLPLLVALGYINVAGVPGASVQATASSQLPPPARSAQTFIKGKTTYNADLMLAPLADSLRTRLERQGQDRDSMQSRLNVEKEQGVAFRPAYVGALPLDNGTVQYFYTLEGSGSQRNVTFYVLTVDRDGKIVRVF